MTVARDNIAPPPGVSLSPLAARLELLLRRAITMDQFETEMVSCCQAHPDEIWNLLALLDQYHRLERLPTELYRELRVAADRYGLVRREPYIPPAAAVPLPTPESTPPLTPMQAPAPVPAAGTVQPIGAETNETPFRHLLDDAPKPAASPRIDIAPAAPAPEPATTWHGSRYTPPTPPVKRRSRVRALLLPALLLAVALGAAAWLKQGQGSVNMLAGPEDTAQRAASTATAPVPEPPAAAIDAPANTTAAPVPAPAAELEPPVPAGPPPSPVATTAAQAQPPPASPPPVAAPAASAPVESAPAAAAAAGPASAELASGSYTVRPGDSAARIVVRRTGNPNGDLGFTWWTENATAVADVDYVAWGKRTEKIPSGRSSVTLLVPIINDSTRTAPRQFQVVIGRADGGAPLGATTHATVQLTN